jgi:hypothetical protein
MTLDTQMRALASDLIGQFGASAVLQRDEYLYDRVASKGYLQETQQYTIKLSPPEPYQELRDGAMVKTGEMKTMVAAVDLEIVPDEKDRIIFAGATWTVVAVEAVWSGEQVAAYILRLQK